MPIPTFLCIIMEVVACLRRSGNFQKNLWVISWHLAHPQLLVLNLLRTARTSMAPKMIENSREERARGFVLFTDNEGGRWIREVVVAESFNRWMPRVGGNLCVAGDGCHRIHNRGGRAGELGPQGRAGSKGFLRSDKCTSYSFSTPTFKTMMRRHHSLLLRFNLDGRM